MRNRYDFSDEFGENLPKEKPRKRRDFNSDKKFFNKELKPKNPRYNRKIKYKNFSVVVDEEE